MSLIQLKAMAMHFKSCVGEPRVSRQCHRKRQLTLRSDARFFRSCHPAVEYSQPATDIEDPQDIRGRLCAVSAKGAKTQALTDTIRNSVPNHLAIETVAEEPDLSFNSRHHGIWQNPSKHSQGLDLDGGTSDMNICIAPVPVRRFCRSMGTTSG